MVRFVRTMGGMDVFVNDEPFGHMMRDIGFFTSSLYIKNRVVVSSEDLDLISLKADEVKTHGELPPICEGCKGTPNFPNQIYDPNEGMTTCQAPFHPFNITHFGRVG